MMTKRAKRLLTIVTIWLFTFICAGVGQAETVIEFWYGETGDAYVNAMNQIVERFNNSGRGFKVNITHKGYIGGAQLDQFLTTVVSGVGPDVAYIDGTTAMEYGITHNIVIPLNEVVPPAVLSGLNLLPVPKDAWYLNGTWYGIAMRTDSRGIYINERLFEEAGLNPRAGWKDIVEFDQIAARLTKWDASGKIQILGFAPKGNNFAGELAWLWAFGAKLYDYQRNRPTLSTEPKALAAMNWILSYAQKYGATARTSDSMFRNETLAMYLTSTTQLERYPIEVPDLRWWVEPIPVPAGEKPMTFSSTRGPAIPVCAKYPKEAAEFILYLLQADVQAFWFRETQSIPANFDAFKQILREVRDPRTRTMIEQLPYAVTYPPFFAKVVRPAFEVEVERMRKMEITPSQALENVERASLETFEQAFGK